MERLKSSKTYYDYQNEYNKKTYRRVTVMIPITDTEVIEVLNTVPSMSGYILDLIRKDARRRAKNGEDLGKR